MARIAAKEPAQSSGVHPYNLRKVLQEFERGHISNVLQLMHGDLQQTAKILGITPKTLEQKIAQYNLHPP